MQRLLHAWFLLTRGMTLGVRAVVLDRDGHVLLVRHTYIAGWHLPGGGVELGEPAAAALSRELVEEGGIVLTGPAEFRGVCFNDRVTRRDHVLVYVARSFEQAPGWRPTREIAAAAFFPLDGLPEGTTAATRARIDEVVRGDLPAARWT